MTLKNKLIILISFFSLLSFNCHANESLIDNAIQSNHRSDKNKARDVYRHPKETLIFFGIKPDMHVLEILPGGGWYTEILAPILKDNGQLTVASFGENHPNDYLRGIHMKFEKHLDSNPEIFSKVQRDLFVDEDYLGNIADGSQDMVVTFRNTHNWIRYGGIEDAYKSMYRVLKKGGVLGVVQHRAHSDADPKESAEKGYVPQSYLIRLIEDIGFELIDTSEINANPKDTKDYDAGVWSLPPSLRMGDVFKKKFLEIGESDRMTLRFVKL